MGRRADGKYGGPDGESYTKFGDKTSDYGHWEVGSQYAGTNTDGSKWQNQRMEWVEDDRTFEAPQDRNAWDMDYEDLRDGNFEGAPEQDKDTSSDSPTQKAQDLVDTYTANITGGSSIYNTGIQSPTPNLNTQTPTADAAVESNTYIDPDYSVNNSEKKAAESFLDTKKLQLGSGLKL